MTSAVKPMLRPMTSFAEAVLNALPHPVIVIGQDGKIADANVAAEAFFESSVALLRRNSLRDVVPFLLAGGGIANLKEAPFTGASAREADLVIEDGTGLMDFARRA